LTKTPEAIGDISNVFGVVLADRALLSAHHLQVADEVEQLAEAAVDVAVQAAVLEQPLLLELGIPVDLFGGQHVKIDGLVQLGLAKGFSYAPEEREYLLWIAEI